MFCRIWPSRCGDISIADLFTPSLGYVISITVVTGHTSGMVSASSFYLTFQFEQKMFWLLFRASLSLTPSPSLQPSPHNLGPPHRHTCTMGSASASPYVILLAVIPEDQEDFMKEVDNKLKTFLQSDQTNMELDRSANIDGMTFHKCTESSCWG